MNDHKRGDNISAAGAFYKNGNVCYEQIIFFMRSRKRGNKHSAKGIRYEKCTRNQIWSSS